MSELPCPVDGCAHILKVHSLTRNDCYFCRCQNVQVVKVVDRPGFYGGKVKAVVLPTEPERTEFLGRAPESEWPKSPHAPLKKVQS